MIGIDPLTNKEAEIYNLQHVKDGTIKIRGIDLMKEIKRCKKPNVQPKYPKRYIDYNEHYIVFMDRRRATIDGKKTEIAIRKVIELK